MAGGHGQHPLRHPAGTEGGPQPQGLGHGAAGPEQPRKGDVQLPHGVVGGGALGLQVPCQGQVHRTLIGPRLFQAEPGRPELQGLFGGLPAFSGRRSCPGSAGQNPAARGPSPSFLPPTAAWAAMTGGAGKNQGVAMPQGHGTTPSFPVISHRAENFFSAPILQFFPPGGRILYVSPASQIKNPYTADARIP